MTTTAVVWVRHDCRLHDNPTLAAASEADRLIPVYVFDPDQYGRRPYGGDRSFAYRKTGPHRARFRRETIEDLRASLRDRGSDLLVRHGDPGEAVGAVADAVDADTVHCATYALPEERDRETAVREALAEQEVDLRRHWTHTLHHPDDLPTPPSAIADTFTPFKNAVEAESAVRDPVPVPDLPGLPDDTPEPGSVPEVSDLDPELSPVDPDDRGALPFAGGETAGLDRLETYVWERDRLREYKETRNGLVGADYSSKLSPWLAVGALSPRRVHETVEAYEAERVANESTYWLVFELRWRDFWAFQFRKHGATHFTRPGIRDRTDVAWRDDDGEFERWARGETGLPFVDAGIRELNATGYLSNRARQNVASFLANDLRIDWRRGAAYFERQLVDYDPASNYGNWAYIAGVGNDSRNRAFDVVGQAEYYDPDAAYVTRWVPELAALPAEYAREPWRLSDEEAAEYGVVLGDDYPRPMIDPAESGEFPRD